MSLKYFNVRVLQESIILIMTPAGVMYVNMSDSCRSQVSPCMTPAGVKYVSMHDSSTSQVSQCMTPAGCKYVIMQVCHYDSCKMQVCQYA